MPDMIRLAPGDRVLVAFGEDISAGGVLGVLDELRERFPDVEFTALFPVRSVVLLERIDTGQRSEVTTDG